MSESASFTSMACLHFGGLGQGDMEEPQVRARDSPSRAIRSALGRREEMSSWSPK